MTRVLLISGLPSILEAIVRRTLAGHADVELVVADTPAGGLVAVARDGGVDVVLGSEDQLPSAEVCALLDEFPRSRVFTLTADARMAWLCELRPERVALGEVSPEKLAEAIRKPRLSVCAGMAHG